MVKKIITLRVEKSALNRLQDMARAQRTDSAKLIRKGIDLILNFGTKNEFEKKNTKRLHIR